MNELLGIFSNIWEDGSYALSIIALMIIVAIMSFYEFIVYRIVSRRSMYNKAFHISIMIMPFFISAIIYAVQSNIAITLGTIGALAIIRYRTAVKDPIDMLYILWSVFIGISCGCQLYKLCIITSVVVTIVLMVVNVVSQKFLTNPYVLVVNTNEDNAEDQIINSIKSVSKKFKIKSRNVNENGTDYIFLVETKKSKELTESLKNIKGIKRFSLLEYDNEDSI